MFSLLPTSLLAFLFTSPALAAPVTPNDLFHDLAIRAPKHPEEPICCLRPLSPLEPPTEQDILISFEDWKAKRLSEAREQDVAHPVPGRPPKPSENLSEAAVAPETAQSSSQVQEPVVVDVQDNGANIEALAPHFQIPTKDRFNYASLDCSARVHAAHKSAKSASSILSSKKDRYMLSPCEEERQYVIVELCEDIRIDTVQLANYEFFSGVFKDFSVSVAKAYHTDPARWTFAGTYRAKNVRGVQSFHPPPTLRDFYRFIRIDFQSHYGSEYYCPVSLLRVYGLTHLEEWQWETWEEESRAKQSVKVASAPVEVVAEPPEPEHTPATELQHVEDETETPLSPAVNHPGTPTTGSGSRAFIPVTSDILNSLQYNLSSPIPASSSSTAESSSTSTDTVSLPHKTPSESHSHDSARSLSDHLYNTHVSLSSAPSQVHSTAPDNHSSSTSIFIDTSHSDSHVSSSSSLRSSAAIPNVSSLATLSPSLAMPNAPVSTGGESIYRTIMNRLTALEANTTLYARYVEEQTAGMREVLRRLTEDIGRLEGIGKAQAQLYHRSVVELEKQTRRLENEQRELLSRVDYLTDEVILEKRLGIAQLCLLLTVLVFMALTRGSRSEHAYPRGTVREWGRRTLSFSGGLVNRLRTRSSTPPRPGGANPPEGEHDLAFPALEASGSEGTLRARRKKAPSGLSRPHTPTSLRTPNSRHLAHHRIPASPTYHFARPGIQRSSSGSLALGAGFGGIGPVPRSAKRWARSAHLHEVKLNARAAHANGDATPLATPGAGARDVFDDAEAGAQVLVVPPAFRSDVSVVRAATLGKGKGRAVAGCLRQPSPLRAQPVVDLSSPPLGEDGAGEGDVWVDTDADGSECESGPEGGGGLRGERTFNGAAIGQAARSSL